MPLAVVQPLLRRALAEAHVVSAVNGFRQYWLLARRGAASNPHNLNHILLLFKRHCVTKHASDMLREAHATNRAELREGAITLLSLHSQYFNYPY
jgi:hypothetical protein